MPLHRVNRNTDNINRRKIILTKKERCNMNYASETIGYFVHPSWSHTKTLDLTRRLLILHEDSWSHSKTLVSINSSTMNQWHKNIYSLEAPMIHPVMFLSTCHPGHLFYNSPSWLDNLARNALLHINTVCAIFQLIKGLSLTKKKKRKRKEKKTKY